MSALLVSDLHLTANPRDEYRWRIFDQIKHIATEHWVKDLFILGDLTEAKDFHSARLVNRIVSSLLGLYSDKSAGIMQIWVIFGNHDGLDPNCPFFGFLGRYPCINFISTPFMRPISGNEVLMLPHTRDPVRAWEMVDMHQADFIFMHATVRGALGENGMALEGIPPGLLSLARRAKIFSGDVHVPQTIGKVEYIGAPYPIKFGDNFQPRAILLKDWRKAISIPLSNIRRLMVTMGPEADITTLGLLEGDQIKVRVQLQPSEFHLWSDFKRRVLADAATLGVAVCGLELLRPEAKPLPKIAPRRPKFVRAPQAILREYCEGQKVDVDMWDAGTKLIEEVQNEKPRTAPR